MLLAILKTGNVASTHIFPQTVEFWNILSGDKGLPAFDIKVNREEKRIVFRGGLRAGAARELIAVMRANPETKVLFVNSPGGRIHEALRMAELVRELGLDTYTSEYCLSAATLVFIAGKERIIGQGAKLGFHAGSFPGVTPDQIASLDSLSRQSMVSAGVSQEFINRALATPNSEMWYPTVEELRLGRVITKEDAPLKFFAANLNKIFNSRTNSESIQLETTGRKEIDLALELFSEFFPRWFRLFTKLNNDIEATGGSSFLPQQHSATKLIFGLKLINS